jgi:hypothetical protein
MSNAGVDGPSVVSWRERSGARAAGAPAVLIVLATFLGACAGRQVRLVSPDTTAGARYTCAPGEGGVCQPATVDVPEELNASGTLFVILPRECQGRIHQIVVIDAGSSTPKVDATCAPKEEPLGEMSRREPSAPNEVEASPVGTGEQRAADVSVH